MLMDLDVVVKKGAIKDDFGLRLKQFLKVEQAKARTVWTVHLSLVKSDVWKRTGARTNN